MNAKTKQHNDDVIIIAVAICYTLFTLLFQLISELWHSLSEQLLIAEVVGYEPVTDDEGTQQYPADVDFQDAPKGAIPVQETSTRTRRASSVATGFQPVATTRQRNRTNSRAGTTYLTSKTSKSLPSTPAAQLLQEMM
jgi:hypothetical protein